MKNDLRTLVSLLSSLTTTILSDSKLNKNERDLSMSDIVDLLESSSSTSVSNECLNVLHDEDLEENNETPLQSLVRLHSSYSNYNERKNAVKYIVDALRSVEDVQQLEEILSCTKKLADDIVTQVQIDCLEKFVPIIEYLVENVENAHLLIKEYLYQSIIQTIGHPNNRIRKGSQSALIRLFEFDQIPLDEIEETLIPSLCQLDRSCDDFKNESILLMTRLTQYVSHDLVLKYFLPTIVQQSTSIAFQTRKTCATAIGDLSTVLPQSAVDQHLVPCLSQLCSDPFWGVRKSCAEVIHPVAQVCSEESRWNILSPCLIQLLQDQSRWVKTAALRVLGYFISTFLRPATPADPSPPSAPSPSPPPAPAPPSTTTTTTTSNLSEFNDFFFWKDLTYLHVSIDEENEANGSIGEEKEESPLGKALKFPSDDVQRILPMELLDSYRNLIEQSYSSGVEVDIVHQGAHTFPAVALTLTSKHWHLIRETHRKFAEDLQWKVRRTLAYSLHELAKILDVDQVEEDLCPTFDSFLRDVDEVKIGILSHLTEFLRVLNIETRRTYLDKLNDLISSDNQRNWRFRSEAANQLNELTKIYPSSDIAEHLCPLMFSMSMDRVAFVRLQAIEALSSCFVRYADESAMDSLETFVDDSIRLFAQSTDWKRRQLFVQLVEKIFFVERKQTNEFEKKLLNETIRLKSDPVVNVRLSLASFLAQQFNRSNPLKIFVDLQSTVDELAKDADRDVRSAIEQTHRPSTGSSEEP